jgi:hypothetical protein
MQLSSPLRGGFSPRLLSGVEVMKRAFNVLFTLALIAGLASTVAANAQLGTALQVPSVAYLQ